MNLAVWLTNKKSTIFLKIIDRSICKDFGELGFDIYSEVRGTNLEILFVKYSLKRWENVKSNNTIYD